MIRYISGVPGTGKTATVHTAGSGNGGGDNGHDDDDDEDDDDANDAFCSAEPQGISTFTRQKAAYFC